MSSVLERPRVRERITEEDWEVGDISMVSTHGASLVAFRTSIRRFAFPFLGGQLVLESESLLPSWFRYTVASLDELARLPANWDSYGAMRIRHSSILATVGLLASIAREDTPSPSVVPTNRGTVMLEWHVRGIDLEVEVFGPGRLHVAFEDVSDGTQWEAEIGSDLTRLVECVEPLSQTD